MWGPNVEIRRALLPGRRTGPKFYWQNGYGVVTLRKADVPKVQAYIRDQELLHKQRRLSRILETFEVLLA